MNLHIEILRKKCDFAQSEKIKANHTVETLNTELREKNRELDDVRGRNEELMKDAQTFDRLAVLKTQRVISLALVT